MADVVVLSEVTKRFGATLAVDRLSFDVAEGQCISLLGPSGCGKTTTLRIIAGFERLDSGSVTIAGQAMRDRRPYERSIGLVFQDYALFPHMSVAQNVNYGMRHRGVEKGEAARRLTEVLAMVKLAGYEERRPRQLSGGEQQRVALARALATRPAVLLLDEPMSNLDAKLREQVRVDLKEILAAAGTTTIIVTHDQQEAMSIADQVIVMNRGRVMQMGTPEEIYARPQNRFVAEFVGRMNWFRAVAGEAGADGVHALKVEGDLTLHAASDVIGAGAGAPYDVGVRPERIHVRPDGAAPEGAAPPGRTRLSGRLASLQYLGQDIHFWVEIAQGRRLLAIEKNTGTHGLREGDPVVLEFDAAGCLVLPPDDADGPR